MSKHLVFASLLAVSLTSLATAQTPVATAEAKHYRLNVVVSLVRDSTTDQSFTLDVPVGPKGNGAAKISLISGDSSDASSLVQQTLECSDVHASATGLHINMAMQSDREAAAIPGIVSSRHQHGDFQRQLDIALGTPTVVTNEMVLTPLGDTDPALAAKLAPRLKITITAVAIEVCNQMRRSDCECITSPKSYVQIR